MCNHVISLLLTNIIFSMLYCSSVIYMDFEYVIACWALNSIQETQKFCC